jgi:hypothetical protein
LDPEDGMRRRRRTSYKPVVSAFLAGLLASVGLDPGRVLVESAVQAIMPYLQFAAWALLLVVLSYAVYSTFGSISRYLRALQTRGVVGLIGVLAAIAAGYLALSSSAESLLLLIAGVVAWMLGYSIR